VASVYWPAVGTRLRASWTPATRNRYIDFTAINLPWLLPVPRKAFRKDARAAIHAVYRRGAWCNNSLSPAMSKFALFIKCCKNYPHFSVQTHTQAFVNKFIRRRQNRWTTNLRRWHRLEGRSAGLRSTRYKIGHLRDFDMWWLYTAKADGIIVSLLTAFCDISLLVKTTNNKRKCWKKKKKKTT